MATKRVSIVVPNPGHDETAVRLRLEPLTEADLRATGYTFPAGTVRIRSARLSTSVPSSTLSGCLDAIWTAILAVLFAFRRRPSIGRPLHLVLAAQTEATAEVAIDAVGGSGAAGIRVVDERSAGVVGGVTMLVVRGDVAPARPVAVPNLCGLELDREPYWLGAGSMADEMPIAQPIPTGAEVQFVAWISNPTETSIEDGTAYLEHLGPIPATFVPRTWHLGSVAPGAQIPLTWRVLAENGLSGDSLASIVVSSAGSNPKRLRAPFKVRSLSETIGAVPVESSIA